MGALPRDWLVACLLLCVREDGASGRDLVEEMRYLGFGSVRPGEMYRTLREMKGEGLVVHEARGAEYMLSRRRYTITTSAKPTSSCWRTRWGSTGERSSASTGSTSGRRCKRSPGEDRRRPE